MIKRTLRRFGRDDRERVDPTDVVADEQTWPLGRNIFRPMNMQPVKRVVDDPEREFHQQIMAQTTVILDDADADGDPSSDRQVE